ncbi:MAG: MFS transporter [Burkholderiales bacterium]|jgi:MFS family permease|nr:MFS transporter [Burkholderiales bacterium]
MPLLDARNRYLQFLQEPDVRTILIISLITRIPVGMSSLAFLMYLKQVTGSLAFAGLHVGIYLVAMSVAAPVMGRLIDRFGARRLLRVTGIVHPLALWLMLLPTVAALPTAFITACMVVAGIFCPPLIVLTRAVWRYRFETPDLRKIAFSFDAVLTELNFVVGPLLVALALAIASPIWAFLLFSVFSTLAVPLFLHSPAVRYVKHDRAIERHWLGPLTEPRLLLVFVITFAIAMTLGAIEIGYPAFAAQYGKPFWAGILIAFASVGSAVGGLIYGGIHFKSKPEQHLPWMLAALLLFAALHIIASVPGWFLLLAFLLGMLVAPSLTALTLLTSRYTPERYTAEAFTWSSTCIVSGLGAGMALGGALGEWFGLPAIFALGTSSAIASLALAWWLKRLPNTAENGNRA